MRFHNFIFDLDGTLVDSFRDIYFALTATAVHLQLPIPQEGSVQRNMHLRLDHLVAVLYPNEDLNAIMEEFRVNYDGSEYRYTKLYPEVEETLCYFHKEGCQLFVATNKRKTAAEKILTRLKVSPYLTAVIASDIAYPPLSKEEQVGRILVDAKLDLEKTAMVGDAQGDADAAIYHHIAFIFAEYGYGKLKNSLSSRFDILIIDSFSDLKKYI